MDAKITGIEALAKKLTKMAGITDKVAASAANATAFDARQAMTNEAKATNNEGVSGLRVKFASPNRPQATIDSGAAWTEELVSAPLTTEGETRAAGMFGGIRGNFIFLRGQHAPKGKKAMEFARKRGFFARMTTNKKLGLFMNRGSAREISIFYSIKTPEQVATLIKKGLDVCEKNFEKHTENKLSSALFKVMGE